MLHASAFAPLSLWAIVAGAPGSLGTAAGHGGEMLAGYALAVIAGFLLPRMTAIRLALLFTLWLIGRLAVVIGIPGLWAAAPSIVFVAWVAVLVVPRFTGSAKRLRNMATGSFVGAIATAISVAIVLSASGTPGATRTVLYIAVTLLAGLMLFMGGRIIVPAMSDALHRRGERLKTRVQPRLEAPCYCAWRPRWWAWRRRRYKDLPRLAPARSCGCGCSGGGCGAVRDPRTWLFRPGISPARAWVLAGASLLVGLAAISRMAAIMLSAFSLNWLAVATWSLAFAAVLAGLWYPVWWQRLALGPASV